MTERKILNKFQLQSTNEMFMYLFLRVILLAALPYVTCLQWEDPHAMDSKPNINQPAPYTYPKSSRSRFSEERQPNNADIYLKRIIRVMLKNAYLDYDASKDDYSGHVNLNFRKDEYDKLTDFSRSQDIGETILSEISSIFETSLKKTTFDVYREAVLSFQDELFYMIFNRTSGALASASLILFVTYKLLRARFTWKAIIQFFLFLGYVFDFVVCYLKILQEEEVNQIVTLKTLGSIPPECDPNNMSWWDYMKTQVQSTFYESKCKQYYEATHPNFRLFVQPLKILNVQFGQLVVEPISLLGEAFGKFGRSMFTSLPWGLNIILYPIVLISTLAIIVILLIFIRGEPFRVRLFHFVNFEWGQIHRVEDDQRGRLPRAHRDLIEDVPSDNSPNLSVRSAEESSSRNAKISKRGCSNVADKKLNFNCHVSSRCVSNEDSSSPNIESPTSNGSMIQWSPGSPLENEFRLVSDVSTNTTHQILDTSEEFTSGAESGANEEASFNSNDKSGFST